MFVKLKSLLLWMLFAINNILTAVGFYYLYSSPFTGLMISMQMNQAIVRKVDKGSPAEKAGVNKGGVLLDVEGMGLPYFTFSPDPDYVSSRKDYRLLWKSIAMLDTSVRENKPLELSMKRDGAMRGVLWSNLFTDARIAETQCTFTKKKLASVKKKVRYS